MDGANICRFNYVYMLARHVVLDEADRMLEVGFSDIVGWLSHTYIFFLFLFIVCSFVSSLSLYYSSLYFRLFHVSFSTLPLYLLFHSCLLLDQMKFYDVPASRAQKSFRCYCSAPLFPLLLRIPQASIWSLSVRRWTWSAALATKPQKGMEFVGGEYF